MPSMHSMTKLMRPSACEMQAARALKSPCCKPSLVDIEQARNSWMIHAEEELLRLRQSTN